LIELKAFDEAAADLERVVAREPKYDFHRAMALLAHAYAQIGRPADAEPLFQKATDASTASEAAYNYATFLLAQGRTDEAHVLAQRILDKKATMPAYLRRRERPWFRRAKSLLKQKGRQT
jgi:hypothetical protein